MRDNSVVPDAQLDEPARPRRGRPRKWPSEAARREHEAAKRRLRNKTAMTPDEFDDVLRLTALADDLQRQLTAATNEVEQLRLRTRELERRLARSVATSASEPTALEQRADLTDTARHEPPAASRSGAGLAAARRIAASNAASAVSR